MKTSLIHLSPSADWHAALARIRGGAQARVILVWRNNNWPSRPVIGRMRSPRAVLRLAQRRSLRQSVPLAVVTANSYIRAESARLGLPLFSNTRQARSAEWGLSQPASFPSFLRPNTTAEMLRSQATSRRLAIWP